ncbi:MAG: glycoside hydrolase family 88 protein [Planctomycetaceae bacterium]
MNRLFGCVMLFVVAVTWPASGAERSVLERLSRESWIKESRLVTTSIGVTAQGTPIPCWIDSAELTDDPKRLQVWVVGGLDGSDIGIDATIRIMRQFHERPKGTAVPKWMSLSAVLVANPDGWTKQLGEKNGSGGQPTRGYPPVGDAYLSKTDPEAAYLWRWLGTQAPDWVIEVRAEPEGVNALDRRGWWSGQLAAKGTPQLIEMLIKSSNPAFPFRTGDSQFPEADSLVARLPLERPAGMGAIPASRLCVTDAAVDRGVIRLEELAERIKTWRETLSAADAKPNPRSGERGYEQIGRETLARAERQRRQSRTPIEVARQLSQRYGHSLKSVQYIPAVAVIGRLRLSELTNDPSHRQAVEKLLEPYVSGKQSAIGDKPSGGDFAGHLVFGELALRTTDEPNKAKLIALAKAAADFAFDKEGRPLAAMPSHVEMSDAVFMACPILAQVGRLTGDVKYHDMAVRHLSFMRKLCARPDGLYRNSPLNEAAWGRGNGFPALGLALTLTDLPAEHPGRAEMLRVFQEHLAALRTHQDPTGMWHQVIDHDESYRELTATCMITFAMLRGMKQGWLDRATFEPCVGKAWPAILARIGTDGSLIDVCEGTGKQTSLRAYLDRKALLGFDDRGGAMALLVATEMAAWR